MPVTKTRFSLCVSYKGRTRMFGVFSEQSAAERARASWLRVITHSEPSADILIVPIHPASAQAREAA